MVAGCGSLSGRTSVDRLSWETPWQAGVRVCMCVHTGVCLCMGKCTLKSSLPAASATMCKHARSSPQLLPSSPSLASLASCPRDS